MYKQATIDEAYKRVLEASKKFGRCPEGSAYFASLYVDILKEAERILTYPHLTGKADL